MIFLNGKYYVEGRDKKFTIHPDVDIIIREGDHAKSLRPQKHVINKTQTLRKQKGLESEIDHLEVKPYPKRNSNKLQNNVETPKIRY